MRKLEEFDNILDTCLEQLIGGNETVEQCLGRFPQYADELKPLLETALMVRQASAIEPRTELKDRARYQFYSALEELGQRRRFSFFNWQPRWATVLAAFLVFLLVSGGTVAAAENSMPDQALYPVKLATEQVRLAITPSKLGKAELYAELADRRVSEIVSMADKNNPEKIESATRRLDDTLAQIAVLSSPQEVAGLAVPAEAPVTMEAQPAEDAGVAEKAPMLMERQLPEAARVPEGAAPPEPAQAPELVPPLPELARTPEPVPPAPPPVVIPEDAKEKRGEVDQRAKLKGTIESQAADHPARLRALLEKVPESARPALLRAIAVSESGYEKALESLED